MILAISDFVTVFEISTDSNGVFAGEVFRLLIGDHLRMSTRRISPLDPPGIRDRSHGLLQ